MSKPKYYSRMGPESDEYNRLKGQKVRIWPQGVTDVRATWCGRLVWVDFDALGVAMNPTDSDSVSIIDRAGIRVDRIPGIAVSDETEGDNNSHGAANAG
jgi:hypothetical protein